MRTFLATVAIEYDETKVTPAAVCDDLVVLHRQWGDGTIHQHYKVGPRRPEPPAELVAVLDEADAFVDAYAEYLQDDGGNFDPPNGDALLVNVNKCRAAYGLERPEEPETADA